MLKKHIRKRIIKVREIKNKNNLKVKFSLLYKEFPNLPEVPKINIFIMSQWKEIACSF